MEEVGNGILPAKTAGAFIGKSLKIPYLEMPTGVEAYMVDDPEQDEDDFFAEICDEYALIARQEGVWTHLQPT